MISWENYGDINPLEHGGRWFLQDGEHSYKMVEIVNHIEKDETWIVYDMYIDVEDWMDDKRVRRTTGTEEGKNDDVSYAMDCIDYYGGEEFGAQPYEISGRENIIMELKKYGIEIKQ